MKKFILLTLACLSMWAISGCQGEKLENDDEPFCILISSPMLTFDLRNEQGEDLLAVDNPAREELLRSIQLRCDGKAYPLVISDKPLGGEARLLTFFFSGFHFAPQDNAPNGSPKLMFGQLAGYLDVSHRIEFVWPNGQTEIITYDNKLHNSGTRNLKIDRVFTLNGKTVPSGDITLVSPK